MIGVYKKIQMRYEHACSGISLFYSNSRTNPTNGIARLRFVSKITRFDLIVTNLGL